MTSQNPVAHETHVPAVLSGFFAVHGKVGEAEIDPNLRHLIELRASQINQCGFCVKMHTDAAKKDGETAERIERLTVWRSVDDYTPAEKAALAWTEALTVLSAATDYTALRERLRAHYSDAQISALTSAIALINVWNRFQVSNH